MKQAHDEILENWMDDILSRIDDHGRYNIGEYHKGYLDAFKVVKDKLEELWREK